MSVHGGTTVRPNGTDEIAIFRNDVKIFEYFVLKMTRYENIPKNCDV